MNSLYYIVGNLRHLQQSKGMAVKKSMYATISVWCKSLRLCSWLVKNAAPNPLTLHSRPGGEAEMPLCQCWWTVAPAEQAAANDRVTFTHSLLLQVSCPPALCSWCSLMYRFFVFFVVFVFCCCVCKLQEENFISVNFLKIYTVSIITMKHILYLPWICVKDIQ